ATRASGPEPRAPSPEPVTNTSPGNHDHCFMSFHDEEILGKAYDARLMRRLLTYVRPYRRQVVFAIAAIIAGSVLQLAPPYLTKLVIDRYFPARVPAGLGTI